jgi:hypothetical protein
VPDPTVIEGALNGPTPTGYTLGGSQVLEVKAAFAKFDGSGAAGPFLACIGFYAQDGTRFSRSFNPSPVAAGETAEVSFAPFPGGLTGSGIRFNVDNRGGWLDITTSGFDPSSNGVRVTDDGGGGLVFATTPAGGGPIGFSAAGEVSFQGATSPGPPFAITGFSDVIMNNGPTGINAESFEVDTPVNAGQELFAGCTLADFPLGPYGVSHILLLAGTDGGGGGGDGGAVVLGAFDDSGNDANFSAGITQFSAGPSYKGLVATIGVGQDFNVVNEAGQPLLKVTNNGTYHIKAGAAWVADL